MILIIDDHQDTGEALARLLNRCGQDAVAVGGGTEALKMMETVCPSVIVLDMMMPQMHGLEVLERVRGDPAVKDVPVVVFSADSSHDTMRAAMRLGAQEFIVKGTARWTDVCRTIAKHNP